MLAPGAPLALAVALWTQVAAAQLFGAGLAGFKTVALEKTQTAVLPVAATPVPTTVTLPYASIPLAKGLSLQGTTAYVSGPPAPSGDCLTISLDLFTGCQPFLEALVNNGGQISKLTVLQLLMTAQNKTASDACFKATLTFMNKGCVCDATTYNALQAMPTSTVPELVKQTTKLLTTKMCPNGLVSSTPPAASAASPASSGVSGASSATAMSGSRLFLG